MLRFEDLGLTQQKFLWIAYHEGVGLDDPVATDARIARLERDGLIHQRTSKGDRVSWRATELGRRVLTNHEPLDHPDERSAVKRDVARRRKGSSRTRNRASSVELVTDAAAETLRYWREHNAAWMFVYFIQEGMDGPIKIGEAADPPKRLEHMQCGNPRPLRVVAVILAERTTEWQLHGYWRSSAWIRGEWFGRGHQEAILAKAQQIAEAQIDAHRDGESIEAVRSKVFVRALFSGFERQTSVV